MNVVIIIPTYNERDNIGLLIDQIHECTAVGDDNLQILVVDDNSPDGTAALVTEKSASHDNIHLLTGPKAGLGAAYTRGMQYAIDRMAADAIVQMDADFSHKPADLPRLLDALQEGADFVIGSRYVQGGSIPQDWNFIRKLNSHLGNAVARYLAGMYRVRDCTAGFRVIRASLLKQINVANLKVQGYAFQVALLHEAIIHEARVKELPVNFIDRTRGESKLGVSDIIEFIFNAWWIRLRQSTTFIKFSAVGASGVLVNLLAFTLLIRLELNKYLASPIAIEASILWNFFLNNYWTFRARRNQDTVHIKGLKFNLVSFVSLGVSYTTFVVLSLLVPDVAPQVHQFAGIIPAALVNYFMNSYWTFRESNPTAQVPSATHAPDGRSSDTA